MDSAVDDIEAIASRFSDAGAYKFENKASISIEGHCRLLKDLIFNCAYRLLASLFFYAKQGESMRAELR